MIKHNEKGHSWTNDLLYEGSLVTSCIAAECDLPPLTLVLAIAPHKNANSPHEGTRSLPIRPPDRSSRGRLQLTQPRVTP